MIIRQATADDVDAIGVLFDQYRQFYDQAPDLPAARRFIGERMAHGESTILCAEHDGELVGFTQLYPSFTSVGMAPILVLNDLYVATSARRQGVAQALLETAVSTGADLGAVRLTLETTEDNRPAQTLYEGLGWQRESGVFHYQIST